MSQSTGGKLITLCYSEVISLKTSVHTGKTMTYKVKWMWFSEQLFEGLLGRRNMDLRRTEGSFSSQPAQSCRLFLEFLDIRVLRKVNNVESPGEFSLWFHIPSENRSLSLFIGPIRLTRAELYCCCAILKRRERNRVKIFPHQPPSYSSVTFFPLYVTITSLLNGKI